MAPWGNDNAAQGYVAHGSSNTNYNNDTALEVYQGEFSGAKGDKQPKQFNDVFFSILFGLHLVVMGVLLIGAISGGNGGYYNNNDGGGSVGGMVYACSVCGVFAAGLSTVSLGFMMKFTHQLIQTALFFSVASSLALSVIGFLSANLLMGILGLVSFAFGCCYAYFVWSRIPFAAANLNTALTAVRDNLGLTIVAYLFLALALGWSIWWSVATGGLMEAYGGGIAFLLLLSYYWVHQVLQNTMHVTTAGTIGTWWFDPAEASSFCSTAISDSFARATTYSFGSICFGSLIVAIIQALRTLNRYLRDSDDAQCIVCVIDCILGCIESIIEYFNKWAYVYIGLYGYNYLDAGRNVLTLFQNKGWTTIITDDLTDNVLFMISVGIGLLTGLVGLTIAKLDQNLFANMNVEDPASLGFLLGLLVGFVMSSILMGVVSSAVNTVIVCFAESPREFEVNHPQLSMEMRDAWRRAWPEECNNL